VQRELVLVARLQDDLRTYTRQTVSNHTSNESRPHAPEESGARLRCQTKFSATFQTYNGESIHNAEDGLRHNVQ
jgi:hypothetical protein